MQNKDIIDELVELRIKKGWSQKELGLASDLPQATISRIEAKKHSPTLKMLSRMAEALDCKVTLRFIYDGEGPLPRHPDARMWAKLLLNGDWDIRKTLDAVFGYYASGINFKAKYENAAPLIAFVLRICTQGDPLPTSMENNSYFLSKLKSVAECIEKKGEGNPSLLQIAGRLRELYALEKQNFGYISLAYYHTLIFAGWEVLKDYSFTYSFLAELVRRQRRWPADQKLNAELISILKEISNEWEKTTEAK